MQEVKLPFYARLSLQLVSIIAIGFICVKGQNLVVPLLFAFLFAVLILPVANFFENKLRLSRSLAALLTVLILLLAVSLIFYLLGAQITTLSSEWPALKTQLDNLLTTTQHWLADTWHINFHKQTVYIKNATEKVVASSGTIVEKTIVSLSSTLLFLVFILIYTTLILLYRRLLMNFIVAAFTDKHRTLIYEVLENIKLIIRKYITGLFFEMVIVAVISGIVFWMLGINYIFLLALIVGIFNVIPYIGIFTALVLGVLIAFATTDGNHALLVGIAIVCIHLFDSNFLMPKIVGSKVKLNPLIVIVGVIIGEMFFGISGMFLSIPYLAVAKVIFDRVESMQSWGILLGEEAKPPKKIRFKLRRSK
jgi:predicted PurR-regulated permease PerM